MKEYATSNIYVGIRCDYKKNMICYPDGDGTKGMPGHYCSYDAFINTPIGFVSLTTEKVLPIYEEEVYVKRNYAFNLELKNQKIPTVMTREEIKDFVLFDYSTLKREEDYKKMIKK